MGDFEFREASDAEQVEKWKLFGSIGWQQKRLQRVFERIIAKAAARYPDCHVSLLLRVQDMILDNGGKDRIDLADIGRITGDSPQMTSRAMRTLEQEGLIERHSYPEDRRRTYVVITDRGRDVMMECGKALVDFSSGIIEEMGKDKLLQAQCAMEELLTIMEKQFETGEA